MNSPTVIIFRFRFVLVKVDVFFRVVVDQKFIVKSEVGVLAGEVSYPIAPDLFVIRTHNADGQVEVEVVGVSCIVADPAHSARIFIQEFGKGVDERILIVIGDSLK